MNLLLDPHVHLYPNYKESFFQTLLKNLKELSIEDSDITLGAVLTERDDCNFYHQLQHNHNDICAKFGLTNIEHHKDYIKLNLGVDSLLLFPGVQINTIEKIELLGLFTNEQPNTRLPLKESVQFIVDNHGIPVINWAPGKWTGTRAKVIKEFLLRESLSRECLLGISKLLPIKCSLPSICTEEGSTLPLILGSDPLPFKGEERQAGSCGLAFNDLDEINSTTIKKRLLEKDYIIIGKRNNAPTSLLRLIKNEVTRRL